MQKWVMKLVMLTLLALVLLGISACTSGGYRNVNADEAQKLIAQGDMLIVDVRQPHEFNQGHIKNSQLIPMSELASAADQWSKDQKVLLVCASGSRSAASAQMLAEKGYTEIYNLSGGVYQWPFDLVK